MNLLKELLIETTAPIMTVVDHGDSITIKQDGEDRFLLRPWVRKSPHYKRTQWNIWDYQKKKDRINTNKGSMSKAEAIAWAKGIPKREAEKK